MQWIDLLSRLEEYAPSYTPHACMGREVHSYEWLSAEAIFAENVLFIGLRSQLFILEAQGFPTYTPMLLAEDVQARDGCGYENVATISAAVSLDRVAQRIALFFAEESRCNANTQRLLACYSANRGLQYLVDVAAEMLGNPLIVADVTYKILAISKRGFEGRPDIEVQRELGYVLAENVSELKQDKIHEEARKSSKPLYTVKKSGDAWLTALIYVNGVEAGHIDSMEQSRPFTEGDFRLMEFLCGLASLELQKSDFFKANRGFLHSFFLTELLDGQILDTEIVDLRLQHLNWHPGTSLYVMVLVDTQLGAMEGKSSIIAHQIYDLLPGCRWAVYSGALVFLLNFSANTSHFLEPDGPLEQYLQVNHLKAGTSDRFDGLLNTRRHYLQALKALELGTRLHPDRPLLIYSEYVCQHIGEIINRNHNLNDFLHPAVLKILQHDQTHKTNLLQTLEQHLLNGDNPTLVAANLFIHRNTLFYRIGKLKELFGLDLSSGDERMKLLMSLRFLSVMQR